jgi:hypothetical protein
VKVAAAGTIKKRGRLFSSKSATFTRFLQFIPLFMSESSQPIERPRFLSFLCMLTFISCVSGLWTQSDRLWNPGVVADQTRELFEQMQENMEAQTNESNAEFMENLFDSVLAQTTFDTIRLSAIIMLIYESLTLYGAYLMWGLQKRGFYFYLGGVAVVIIAPLFLIGGWLGAMTIVGGAFFSIIFSFLYRSQLKYMA